MIESGVVFNKKGAPIYWHLPEGRTAGSIPDCDKLWNFLWENREIIGGVAHSHPGSGLPVPSQTDVQTFSAIERALGKKLLWPIVSKDQTRFYVASGKGKFGYEINSNPFGIDASSFMPLVRRLRDLSYERSFSQRVRDWCVRLFNS